MGEKDLYQSDFYEDSRRFADAFNGISMDPALMKELREDGEEVYNMCKAFEDYKEEGREEGRREIIRRLMMNLNLSFEQVLKLLDIPVSDSDKYRSAIE